MLLAAPILSQLLPAPTSFHVLTFTFPIVPGKAKSPSKLSLPPGVFQPFYRQPSSRPFHLPQHNPNSIKPLMLAALIQTCSKSILPSTFHANPGELHFKQPSSGAPSEILGALSFLMCHLTSVYLSFLITAFNSWQDHWHFFLGALYLPSLSYRIICVLNHLIRKLPLDSTPSFLINSGALSIKIFRNFNSATDFHNRWVITEPLPPPTQQISHCIQSLHRTQQVITSPSPRCFICSPFYKRQTSIAPGTLCFKFSL
ncbi:unnamed protein product [Acanthosepion pharaonis]|uniref:Uncharacterized protein n=1 Tax=Acanthosepion pharaonis TaxID=158019 RepID=A0A812DMU3_ACAPH|nr:unnamed protein product [Sepia pharaonis]